MLQKRKKNYRDKCSRRNLAFEQESDDEGEMLLENI